MNKEVVLITGGSSGAGLEKAKIFNREGYKVVICGRDMAKLQKAEKSIKGIDIIKCDVTKDEDREALLEHIKTKYKRLDILINNAGIAKRYKFESVKDLAGKTSHEIEVNYIAPILLAKMFLPLLKGSSGKIVNVTSGLVYVPLFIEPNYCATKAALHSYTVALRWQLKNTGVKVIEVFYPEMDTPFQEGHASNRAIKPDVAAEVAYKGIVEGKEEIRVKAANLLYRLSRLMPNRMNNMLNSLVFKQLGHINLPD